MIEVEGGPFQLQRRIRAALTSYPRWYVSAARVSKIVVSTRPDVIAQIAMYEHGTRILYIAPNVGDVLLKAVGHELAHGCDDIYGWPHYFSSHPDWVRIHRNQPHFDIPKYREEALEYLADMAVKCLLLGPEKLATTQPDEVLFVTTVMFATLMKEFSHG